MQNKHSTYMKCWDCLMWGTPAPHNKNACGNCGSHNVTVYVPQSAQQSMHLTAFGARLAWLFFGFVLLLAMVLVIIGGR